jgi:MFS family permease
MFTKNKSLKFLLPLAASFEYYDFVIYGLMAHYIGPIFFPNENEFVSQIQAFSVFALGYIARPLGGVIFGILGDLKSKKLSFIRSNMILAISTTIISLLPDYNNIGTTATILIVLLRIIQSCCFAAELPGSMVIISDNIKEKSQSFSFIVSGAALGAITASLSIYFLEIIFSKQEIIEYAWRIPFLFGSILCVLNIIIRAKLPDYKQEKLNKEAITGLLVTNHKKIISAIFIISIPAYMIIMNIFFSNILSKFYNYKTESVHLALSLSMVWSIFFAPLFIYISKDASRLSLLKIIISLSMFLILVINYLWIKQSFYYLLAGLCIYQSIISSVLVIIFPLMEEIFPKQIQFTLMAFCYNVAYSLMSFAPLIVVKFAHLWQSPVSLWIGLSVVSILALTNIHYLDQDSYSE